MSTMKQLITGLFRSHHLMITVGALCLGALLACQTIGLEAASANSRDEFPGRRQGGGTHWVMPSDAR